MPDDPQERSDRSRMRCKRDVRAVVVGEYIVKQLLHAGLDYGFRVSFSDLRGIVEVWNMYGEGDILKAFSQDLSVGFGEEAWMRKKDVRRELSDFLERRGAIARLPRRIRAQWCIRGSGRGCKSYCCAGHKYGFRLLREVIL